MKLRPALALALGTAMLAGACTTEAVPMGFARFQEEQTETDRLPEQDLPPGAPIDPLSTRLLVDRNGDRYYLAHLQENPERSVCLIMYNEDGQSVAGCGGDGPAPEYVLGVDGFGVQARLVEDDADLAASVAEGWKVAHPNLLVRAAPGVQPS